MWGYGKNGTHLQPVLLVKDFSVLSPEITYILPEVS